MMAKALKGTEKQVAWAEDIRKGFEEVLVKMEEAIEILSDTTMVEEAVSDPLGRGGTTVKRYVRDLEPQHEAAKRSTLPWWKIDLVEDRRSQEYQAAGVEHAYRVAVREWYEETAAALKEALETEDSAKYWIDCEMMLR